MRSDFGELITEVQAVGRQTAVPLGTARWMGMEEARGALSLRRDIPSDRLWIGEALDTAATPLGYGDDRHVCLVSGTRGGKGTGVIIPNLCLWPGSCLVIDPKGENATVTARRRAQGSAYSRGMGQKVHILDPFGEVETEQALRARFNPLDVIKPGGDFAVDDAGRIAGAIVVRENHSDPFWEDAARNLLKGLILHVLSAPAFDGARNLVTVRRLLTQGDWLGIALARQAGVEKLPTAFGMLWEAMRRSTAFDGVIAGVGEQMLSMADKTRSGVLEMARTNTVFLDGAPMQRLLEKSDFDLAGIKTDPKGLSLYLVLPQRYMNTHFRWLRLMVSLAVGEMERIKGRPRTGHPTLFLLDEFAGLKRMEVIEHAVAQAAGFGVKFFFVTQNLPQLKGEYEDNWETFVSNSGLKIFFQIDDHFTRDYLSRLLGEQEVRRESRSGSTSRSTSRSATEGESQTTTKGTSTANSTGDSRSQTFQGLFGLLGISSSWQHGSNTSRSRSKTTGDSQGTSASRSDSESTSGTDGWNEAVHKRPLLNPDEIGRFLSRVDDRQHPAYPGLILSIIPGQFPLVTRRTNYFQSRHFEGLFDPHPDHPKPPTLAELGKLSAREAGKGASDFAAAYAAALPPRYQATPTPMLQSPPKSAREDWHHLLPGLGLMALVLFGIFVFAGSRNGGSFQDSLDGILAAIKRSFATLDASLQSHPRSETSAAGRGTTMPLGATAWALPPRPGQSDATVNGIFDAGTPVELVSRWKDGDGWSWIQARGTDNKGRAIDGYVRADLLTGSSLSPQADGLCAVAYDTAWGLTPVYRAAVMAAMNDVNETLDSFILGRLPEGTVFPISRSTRAANGWEWHYVPLNAGVEVVVRADHLRPAAAPVIRGGKYFCGK